MIHKNSKIAILGLGYVGLPLAVEFGKKYKVIGFDINEKRVSELNNQIDSTLELRKEQIVEADGLTFSCNLTDIKKCDIYIVTVPTPIESNNNPNLEPLIKSSKMISTVLNTGDIVIYESTVYPGATEEVCIPQLESGSGLKLNKDFFVGYSPERINPGDKENTLTTIKKITSGSTKDSAIFIDELYSSIITAGTHLVSSIRVAEAAKVIENTQRDLNIAIINEFAKIFNILEIDTQEVLDAAGTKWNFLPFKPGLVGGHCISVDPYYLTYKAKQVGYQPEVILSGRRINDGMGQYVANKLVKAMSSKNIHIDESTVLIMGFTFKGDCPDIRNTKIIDIVHELQTYNIKVDIYDHWACNEDVESEYGINLLESIESNKYDAIIISVDHSDFKDWGASKIRQYGKDKHILYDLKYVLPKNSSDLRL